MVELNVSENLKKTWDTWSIQFHNYYKKQNTGVGLDTTSANCTNRMDAGTSSLTCCSFSFYRQFIHFQYPLTPERRVTGGFPFTIYRISFQSPTPPPPEKVLENTIGWHHIFKCLLSLSAGIVCPHAQSSRDALFYWVKFPASVNGLLRGQSRQGRPDISTPGRVAVYQPPHELTATAAETPPCWSRALPRSLSQPFSMSGVHFANALHNLLSARQKVYELDNSGHVLEQKPFISGQRLLLTAVTFCWTVGNSQDLALKNY